MAKFAMHNDPKLRKKKYDEEKISGTGHNARRMEAEREREREMSNSIAGGSAWPDSKIGPDGKFARKDLHSQTSQENASAGISIFDPVLCELAYQWFSPEGAIIIDPFAGGSVRGIVASKLNRNYIGIDLSSTQIEENKVQGTKLCPERIPTWHCGDSNDILSICADVKADLLFTCPPYADLEVYSDDPKDISNMPYPEFLKLYRSIIQKSCSLLNPDRFAAIVVGEVRGKDGSYYNFVGDTITAFLDAGLKYYNEMILVTAVGSLPIRAGRAFEASRKIGKTHQNILVFVKGDGKKAAKFCGKVDMSFLQEMEMSGVSVGE